MHQAHGLVEYRQLGEWFGVIDVGALLVPNRELSLLLVDVATKHGGLSVPRDASVGFQQLYGTVAEYKPVVATLSYEQARELGRNDAVTSLLDETLFKTLTDLCTVLARQFGENHVRLLFYFD